jgi:hypothetical protein
MHAVEKGSVTESAVLDCIPNIVFQHMDNEQTTPTTNTAVLPNIHGGHFYGHVFLTTSKRLRLARRDLAELLDVIRVVLAAWS